jgi:hypothetical protein
MRRRLLVAGLAVAGVVAMVTPAHAAITTPVAIWQMDEAAGSRTMVDSGPNGINGTVGSDVLTGVAFDTGGTGYRFTNVKPNQPPANPNRIVQVDDSRLNPGTGSFAVEIRMRTTHSFGNVIQKGQAQSPGGQFKFQQPNGKITCLFRDANGNQATGFPGTKRVNDGAWHTVRCERTPTMVTMIIDGVVTGRSRHATGNIANNVPLTIAGKVNCDQVTITCDYFAGDIDYVRIEKG